MANVHKRVWLGTAAFFLLGVGPSLLLWLHQPAAHVAPKGGTAAVERAVAPVPTVLLRGQIVDDDGVPIAGATLQARSEQTAQAALVSAVSDGSGDFQLSGLLPGIYAIEARAEYHELAVLPNVRAPASEPARIVLQRTSTLKGDVIDPDGKPAAGASVTIAGSGIWPPRTFQSDSAGHFELTPVASGIYELRATLGHFTSGPHEGVLLRPASESTVSLRLVPGASLRGRVYDAETGKPLPGATVTVSEDALSSVPVTVQTGFDGAFDVDGLRLLPHRLWVRTAGYAEVTGELHSPGPRMLDFGLRRSGSVAGQVLDEQARPIANVELEVTGKTDSGEAMRVNPPLADTASGALPRPAGVTPSTPPAGDNLGVTLGAVPKVPALGPLPSTDAAGVLAPNLRTDDSGRFRIDGITPGKLVLLARHAGYAAARSEPRTLRPGEHLADLQLVLTRGATVQGRVLDARGFPVARVRIQLDVDGERAPRVTLSAEDGTFIFEALRGHCVLSALPLGQPLVRDELTLRSAETRQVELRLLGNSLELKGRVLDARGFPIAMALVHVEAKSARSPVTQSGTSAADGTFTVTGLPAGPYQVRVEHPAYAPTRLAGLAPKPAEALVIELRPGARLTGSVVDSLATDGLVGARVSLHGRDSGETLISQTGARGSFEFHDLSAQDYDVFVDADAHVSKRASVTLASGAEFELPVVQLVPAGGVSGEVVDRLGAPVWNAEVAAGAPADWSHAARTDHAGHFRLGAIEPGDRLISARHAHAGESSQPAPVRVYPLQDSPGVVLRLPALRD